MSEEANKYWPGLLGSFRLALLALPREQAQPVFVRLFTHYWKAPPRRPRAGGGGIPIWKESLPLYMMYVARHSKKFIKTGRKAPA